MIVRGSTQLIIERESSGDLKDVELHRVKLPTLSQTVRRGNILCYKEDERLKQTALALEGSLPIAMFPPGPPNVDVQADGSVVAKLDVPYGVALVFEGHLQEAYMRAFECTPMYSLCTDVSAGLISVAPATSLQTAVGLWATTFLTPRQEAPLCWEWFRREEFRESFEPPESPESPESHESHYDFGMNGKRARAIYMHRCSVVGSANDAAPPISPNAEYRSKHERTHDRDSLSPPLSGAGC